MPVDNKIEIMNRHSYLNMRLLHAAIGTYPCHGERSVMTVNRVIVVFADSGEEKSTIRDSISGETFCLTPGYLYFMPCNHPSDWDLTETIRFVSLHFNLEFFYGFDVFYNYQGCYACENQALAAKLPGVLENDKSIKTLCCINEILFELCDELLSLRPDLDDFNAPMWHRYEKIFKYTERFGDASTSVVDLAEILGVRNNVFSRNFSRDIGMSPKTFLQNTITRKASEMLLAPDKTIKEIADRLKFSSEYYFSNFFKRQTGMSPSEFKAQYGLK